MDCLAAIRISARMKQPTIIGFGILAILLLGLLLFLLFQLGDMTRQSSPSPDRRVAASELAGSDAAAVSGAPSGTASTAPITANPEIKPPPPAPQRITERPENYPDGSLPGQAARALIKTYRRGTGDADAADLYAIATELYQEDKFVDAHLLHFFLAREGHVPAMVRLARSHDPRYFDARRNVMDQANAEQALKWYRRAADLGDVEAIEQLGALRAWLAEAGQPGQARGG